MPELPEVETVRRGLCSHILNHKIRSVHVLDLRSIRRHVQGVDNFRGYLEGQSVNTIHRRGKFLYIPLFTHESYRENFAHTLIAHLGMSGQFRMQESDFPLEKHAKIVFTFTDPSAELRFIDQRIFGGMWIESHMPGDLPPSIAKLGPDALKIQLPDIESVWKKTKTRKMPVKAALLDQSIIAGVGNIYADEALWLSKLHGSTPVNRLNDIQFTGLIQNVSIVMEAALEQGGTSFDALYVNVNGESGYFSRSLYVYGRTNMGCERCSHPIEKVTIAGRTSHFCPICQSL